MLFQILPERYQGWSFQESFIESWHSFLALILRTPISDKFMSLKVKKTAKADLENKRPLFLILGLALSLSAAYTALEWSVLERPLMIVDNGDGTYIEEEDWVVPITQRSVPAKPLAASAPKIDPNLLKIVPNTVVLPAIDPNLFSGVIDDGIVEIIDPDPIDNDIYMFTAVESRPIFQGCEGWVSDEERFSCFQKELLRFVAKNFEVSEEMMMFSSGEKVFVEFIIEKDGSVRRAKVVRGEDELISKEAVRMVRNLPEFTPAKINGKPVRMSYILPVNVKLQ